MATTSLPNISEATALNDSSQEGTGGEKLCRIRRQVKPGYVSTISGKHYLPNSNLKVLLLMNNQYAVSDLHSLSRKHWNNIYWL